MQLDSRRRPQCCPPKAPTRSATCTSVPRAPLRRHTVRRSSLAASRSARGKMAIEMVILSSLPRSGTSRTQFCPRVDVSPWRRHSGQYAVTAATTPREDAGKVPQGAQFLHDTSMAQVDRASSSCASRRKSMLPLRLQPHLAREIG